MPASASPPPASQPAAPSSDPAVSGPPTATRILCGATALFALVWGIAQFRTALVEGGWRADWRGRAGDEFKASLAWLQRDDRPLDANLRLGNLLSEAFPPDHARAEALYAESLPRDPGSPVLWYLLAHSRAYQGKLDGARAALERSDEIVPLYPRQRYGAIQLWALLGEPDRAAAIARQIGGLGTDYRARAARDLLGIGRTPVEVFAELEAASLPPEDQVRIVRALSPLNADDLRAVMDLVAIPEINDPELRNAALALTLDPLVIEPALRLWRAASPRMEQSAGPIHVENPQLQSSPFASGFDLGWQPPETSIRVRSRWVAPVEDHADAQGFVQLIFPENALDKPFGWRFCRLLADAGPACDIEVRFRMLPAGSSACSVMMKTGEKLVARAVAGEDVPGWQTLTLRLPARKRPEVVNLGLIREPVREGQGGRADAEINIGSISWSEAASDE